MNKMNGMRHTVTGPWTAPLLAGKALLALAGLALALAAPTRVAYAQVPPQPQSPTDSQAPTRTPKHALAQLDQVAQHRAQEVGKQIGLTNDQIAQLAKLNVGALQQAQT